MSERGKRASDIWWDLDLTDFPLFFSIEKQWEISQIEVPQNVGGSFSTLRHPIHLIFDFLERLNTPLHRVKISGRSEQYPQTCARNNPNTSPHVRFLNIHLHISLSDLRWVKSVTFHSPGVLRWNFCSENVTVGFNGKVCSWRCRKCPRKVPNSF